MRYKQIPSSLFATNRKKLLEALPPNAIALIHSNVQMPRNGDQFFPYRQNSDFFYYTGIDQEKSVLLLDPSNADEKNREVLFILRTNEELETWEGHKLTPSEAVDLSGIETIKFADELDNYIHSVVFDRTQVYVNNRENPRFQSEVEPADVRYLQFLKKKYPLHTFERLAPIIAEQRAKKEPIEVDIMRKACSITHKAFKKVLNVCKPDMYEYEIEAEITAEFIRNGAMGHAYAPIVASGINACALHYI
ncbi:MAG: aminopeptidase P N-terminal domain-containing protein, partial [Bacteroidales bacterium]|nr:aminopeptidase P N-terminal domain-containing protein [Bacteroidales bacterium]